MAQQTTVEYVDDLTGGKAAGTVRFALDGTDYEIDLNKKNEAALRKTLAEFIAAGRVPAPVPVPRPSRSRAAAPAPAPAGDAAARRRRLQAIRAWAAENGIPVAERGRLSLALEQQYDEAVAGRPAFSDPTG